MEVEWRRRRWRWRWAARVAPMRSSVVFLSSSSILYSTWNFPLRCGATGGGPRLLNCAIPSAPDRPRPPPGEIVGAGSGPSASRPGRSTQLSKPRSGVPLSITSSGWLHSLRSEPMLASTIVCLPPLSACFACFDARKRRYLRGKGGVSAGVARAGVAVARSFGARERRHISSWRSDIEQQTTRTTFGGRCFESSVFVRRRMNELHSSPSSFPFASPAARCLSEASGSRPRRIARA